MLVPASNPSMASCFLYDNFTLLFYSLILLFYYFLLLLLLYSFITYSFITFITRLWWLFLPCGPVTLALPLKESFELVQLSVLPQWHTSFPAIVYSLLNTVSGILVLREDILNE